MAKAHFNLSTPHTTSLHHLLKSQLILMLLQVEGEQSRTQSKPRMRLEIIMGFKTISLSAC